MNYLAHAYRFLDDPCFVAGTSLPDWMNIADRKNRPRRQFAEPLTHDERPAIAAIARGCVQHHHDDRWFHQTIAFVSLSTRFAVELRELLQPGLGHQAGFVGHISVELLLDAILCERDPHLLDRYYAALKSLDYAVVESAANAICPRPVTQLAPLLPRFIAARFLDDYRSDDGLLMRLGGVMRRVNLPPLPSAVASWLGTARTRIRASADELLEPEPG